MDKIPKMIKNNLEITSEGKAMMNPENKAKSATALQESPIQTPLVVVMPIILGSMNTSNPKNSRKKRAPDIELFTTNESSVPMG